MVQDKEIGRGIVSSRSLKGTTEIKSFFGPDDAWRTINVWEFEIGDRYGEMPEKVVKATHNPYDIGDELVQYELGTGFRYIDRSRA
ncbi:MAG: hypothetical protein HY513_01695 [Candidatus Aenigmarchaeota archaeon]|nr:hypothetical protein [Candidatus Aenigmarchaeota archaeon]